jgi:hypothetical protein
MHPYTQHRHNHLAPSPISLLIPSSRAAKLTARRKNLMNRVRSVCRAPAICTQPDRWGGSHEVGVPRIFLKGHEEGA